MIKKILRTSSLLRVSLLIIATGIALACADIDMPDYPTSCFAPETVHNENITPFFLSYHTLYTESYYNWDSYELYENNVKTFNDDNTDEWSGYFKHKAATNDISFVLYKARLGEIDTMIFYLKKPNYPISDVLESNSILKGDKRSALDFLYYTGFAKRCEPYSTYAPDWWDDEAKAKDPRNNKTAMEGLEEGGLKQITNANSAFVKQRYMFQVLRLYYMEGVYDKCIAYYNSNASAFETPANSMKYRAMGYVAAAYFKQKNYANANLIYARIFNECGPMRISAYLSFHPQDENDWNQALAMAKTDDEKITLWELLGIYKDPYRAAKEIYGINPKADALDLMLVRLVNVEEQFLLPHVKDEDGGGVISDTIKSAPFNEIVDFVKSVADKENTSKPYEWNLAAGYLSWLNNEKKYDKYLAKAAKENTSDKLVQEQVRTIRLLATVKAGKAGDKNFEDTVAAEMNWLMHARHDTALREANIHWTALNMLKDKYSKAGNNLIVELLKQAPDSATIKDNNALDALVKYMSRTDLSPFEQYAISEFTYAKPDLVDMQAVNLMYKYDFAGAVAKYKEDDSAGMGQLYGDPFEIHINDCHDCDATEAGGHAGTKLVFAKEMAGLQAKAKINPKDAAVLFDLANGYYNMSYFGNNRVLYDTKASFMGDAGFEWEDQIDTTPAYMNCHMAEAYYIKAMNASKDAEFKAKCCFMAAKCEQNEFFCQKHKDYKGDFKAGKYFAMLKSNYANTSYYQEVIKECGYFRTYLHN